MHEGVRVPDAARDRGGFMEWRKSSYSSGSGGACVEVARAYQVSHGKWRARTTEAGSAVMSATVDVWGWRARFRLARGQTITDVMGRIPAIESGAPAPVL